MNFSGFGAWWLWRTIYLAKLPRFEKKLRVALDWTLDVLFSKDLVQFGTRRAPTLSRPDAPSVRSATVQDAGTISATRHIHSAPAPTLVAVSPASSEGA